MFCLKLVKAITSLVVAINSLIVEIQALRKLIRLRKPGLVHVQMIEEGTNGMSKFRLKLQKSETADVVTGGKRELVFSVNGGDPITQSVPGDAEHSEPFDGLQGQIVAGTLVDIDDATPEPNRSPPRSFEVELKDTIAPLQPGEVGVEMIEE